MDLATIIGLIGGFGLVGMAIFMGGSFMAFIDPPSILIVIGGTFFVTMACFSVGETIKAQTVMLKAFFFSLPKAEEEAHSIIALAERARKEGVLALQQSLNTLEDTPLLHKGLSMVVDGIPSDEVERVLKSDISAMQLRHLSSVGVFRKAESICPAMGLVGTLIGLVQMLGNLDDPAAIGPAMAVALLTTMYGAILANMVFGPIASKLERNAGEEAMLQKIYAMGVMSVGRQENPRRLEVLINTALPPANRVSYFAD